VHIMKALASHPSAAPSLTEDDSLQLLFNMVANGSLKVVSQYKAGISPLHTIQLHRHAMQVGTACSYATTLFLYAAGISFRTYSPISRFWYSNSFLS